MSKNEKREKRRTRDERIYTPRTARLRVLSCRSAPSKPAHPLSARRLLRSASLAFPVVPPAKPACPAWSKASCAAHSQAPFAPAHRPRCNTLDLVSKIVCQGGSAPFGYPRHETQVSLDSSIQRGASPLDSLCKRNAVPLKTPCQENRSGFLGCFPTEKKQNENRDAHSAFSLSKGTPSPLKTSVNEAQHRAI